MKITVFYDYICPFSYVGSQRLQRIANEYGLKIDWKGYQIHPEYPPQGKKRKRTLKAARVSQSLSSVMEEEDIKFRLPGFVTNSKLALQAAEFSKTKNKFIEFHNRCYDSYFLRRENIGDLNIILDIGEKAGLDRSELEGVILNNEMQEYLDNYKDEAKSIDVLGVPTALFNDFRIHGVQSVETYKSFIKKFSN